MMTDYPLPKIYKGLLPRPSRNPALRVLHAIAHLFGLNYGCMLRFTFNGHEYSGFVCTGCGCITCVEHEWSFCCPRPPRPEPDSAYYDGGVA